MTASTNANVVTFNSTATGGGGGGVSDGSAVTNLVFWKQMFSRSVPVYDSTTNIVIDLSQGVIFTLNCTNSVTDVYPNNIAINIALTNIAVATNGNYGFGLRLRTPANSEYGMTWNTNWNAISMVPLVLASNQVYWISGRVNGTNQSDIDIGCASTAD